MSRQESVGRGAGQTTLSRNWRLHQIIGWLVALTQAIAIVLSGMAALSAPAFASAEEQEEEQDSAAQQPPNILMLVAEDLSTRLGFADDRVAQTPTIDQLAAKSVHFSKAFTTAGVCAPSRAALIMGQHQTSFAAQHMRTTTGPLGPYLARPNAKLKAFPELLRRAGYFTFTDSKLDYQFSGIRAGSGPFSIWDTQGANSGWQQRSEGQPFFGLINFMQTHESGVMSLEGPPINGAHAATRKMRTAAGLNAPVVTSRESLELPAYYPDLPQLREDLGRHYDNIAKMDQQVASILTQLEEDGLAESTIVIWTTDHGDGLPRAKRELFESGIHVPLLIHIPESLRSRYPSFGRPGSTDDRLVSFVDLAPTLLTMAGLSVHPLHHGQSLLAPKQRRYVYASRDRIDEVPDRQRAVRDTQYKYIQSFVPGVAGGHQLAYRDLQNGVRAWRAAHLDGKLTKTQSSWFEPAPEFQLYDLARDPDELNNLAGKKNYRRIQRRLHRKLRRHLKRIGDTGNQPEEVLRMALLSAQGELQQTPPPSFKLSKKSLIISAPDNASIEYTIDSGPPKLYVQPLSRSDLVGKTLSARAVRYGLKASETRHLSVPSD